MWVNESTVHCNQVVVSGMAQMCVGVGKGCGGEACTNPDAVSFLPTLFLSSF